MADHPNLYLLSVSWEENTVQNLVSHVVEVLDKNTVGPMKYIRYAVGFLTTYVIYYNKRSLKGYIISGVCQFLGYYYIAHVVLDRLYDKYTSLFSGEADQEKEDFLNSKDGAPLLAFKEKMDG